MKHLNSDNIRLVIAHTLKTLGNYSPEAENLLLITIRLEDQHGAEKSKSGLGPYKIDRSSHLKIWDDYLAFDPDRASTIRGLASQKAFLQDPHLELITNLAYATAIAWTIYQRNKVTLPSAEDLTGLSTCWEKYFATAHNSQRPSGHADQCEHTLQPRAAAGLLQA